MINALVELLGWQLQRCVVILWYGYITNIFGQVERALTLFATGTVTLAMYTAGIKNVILPKTLTTESGQLSETSTAFNETVWGAVTRARISQSRTVLRDSSLEKILKKAQDLERVSASGSKTSTETRDIDYADRSHAKLQDLSDSEWD
jgi:hypothetical protein